MDQHSLVTHVSASSTSDHSSTKKVIRKDDLVSDTVPPKPSPVVALLIDDQPIVAESIRRLLSAEADIQFHYCSDAQQALSIAAEVRPTVILQDLVMPDTDGLMLVKFFRASPITKDVPIIVLSNREEATIKAEAFSQGANDYLVKLPDPIELIARVRYHSTAYSNLLKRHEADLMLAYNKELEQRVEARTAELSAALDTLKRTQTKLIHDEKMTSLGLLVAGIAHEINNPINFIHNNVVYIENYVQGLLGVLAAYERFQSPVAPEITQESEEVDLDFIRQDLPKIIRSLKIGTERIKNLVFGLRNFSRLDEAELKTANIHQGIDSTLMVLGSKLKHIEIIRKYGDLPDIECFPGQLNQVFMNILDNAIDALRNTLNPVISIQTEVLDTKHIQISIADNGPGIPDDVKSKLFDAFFTTKPIGKGTGLGLSISHQIIVEMHQGVINCQSDPEQGTTFHIRIPIDLSSLLHKAS